MINVGVMHIIIATLHTSVLALRQSTDTYVLYYNNYILSNICIVSHFIEICQNRFSHLDNIYEMINHIGNCFIIIFFLYHRLYYIRVFKSFKKI